jgi:arginine:ornithine antiporter/lysine permease
MAHVLEKAVGPWGSIVVRIGLAISVAGAFLSWTLFAAEIPYRAAKDGMMPKVFAIENAQGSPAGSLWITNIMVQAFLVITYYYNSSYLSLFYIASTAILVPYVLSGAYAFKLALAGEGTDAKANRNRDIFVGLLATIYSIWLIYAAGPNNLLMCALLYAPGILVFWWARNHRSGKSFTSMEALLATGIILAAGVAGYLMWTGAISAL